MDDDRLDEWIAENEEVLENDLTFRAVSVGLLVGYVTSHRMYKGLCADTHRVLLCMTNTYFGLQTGTYTLHR